MGTVIFIYGAWTTPRCWRYFAPLSVEKGYRTLAPAWPLKDRAIDDLVAHPDPRLAKVGVPEIVAHYRTLIRLQSKPPVLIGHSFGGLIVQLLLDQGFGSRQWLNRAYNFAYFPPHSTLPQSTRAAAVGH